MGTLMRYWEPWWDIQMASTADCSGVLHSGLNIDMAAGEGAHQPW